MLSFDDGWHGHWSNAHLSAAPSCSTNHSVAGKARAQEESPMIRILQAAVSGVLFGFGLGSSFEEMWSLSIAFYLSAIFALWLFIRKSLGRIV
jgi:hypothetical protein